MSTAPPPRLDPKLLFDKRYRRDQARLRAYNQLLEQIHQRIFTTSQLTGNASYITYTIPPFIFGLPKLDLEDCVVYLVYMLRQSGYEVKYTYPNLLYISWKHHERNYFLNQNPIMQAMIPPEVKKEQKKKEKAQDKAKSVSFAPDLRGGSLGSSGRDPYAESREPPVRNAMEYVPPNSFVQSVQKPLPEKKNNILADLWNYT
jgi:hypothetical protein